MGPNYRVAGKREETWQSVCAGIQGAALHVAETAPGRPAAPLIERAQYGPAWQDRKIQFPIADERVTIAHVNQCLPWAPTSLKPELWQSG